MLRRLRVCFFSNSPALGGSERSLLELVRELVRGYRVAALVVVPAAGALSDALASAGAAVEVCPSWWWCAAEHPIPEAEIDRRMRESIDGLLARALPRIRSFAPDVVYTQTTVIPWGAVAAGLLGLPHAWHATELGERDLGLHFFFPAAQIIAEIERSAGVIFVPSAFLRTSLGLSRALVLPRFIEVPPAPATPARRFFRRSGAMRLCLIGLVAEGKGQELAIRAAAALRDRGRAIELLLVGDTHTAHQAYRDRLERLTGELGVGDDVHFHAFEPDIYAVMRECDVLLICAPREVFCRVAVEGMMVGKPVIYPASGALVEYMVDGVSGLAYPPGDAAELAARIDWLAAERGRMAALGYSAQAHAKARFTRDAYGGAAYRALASLRRRRVPPAGPPPLLADWLEAGVLRHPEPEASPPPGLRSWLQTLGGLRPGR